MESLCTSGLKLGGMGEGKYIKRKVPLDCGITLKVALGGGGKYSSLEA